VDGMVKNDWQRVLSGNPTFIIAEAGVNHNGDITLARELIDAAVQAKADAVKFQSFRAERMVTKTAPKADYQKRRTRVDESQFVMLKKLELSVEDHQILFEYCRRKRIMFLSTPFDEESADLLESLGMKIFKIPSGELTNHPLLLCVAKKGRPVILSTGMASMEEIRESVDLIQRYDRAGLALLHCTSSYPALFKDVHLRAMETMSLAFGLPIGYSDHTLGIEVAVAAVARGARIIEKHFTLDKNLPGPDHAMSLDPRELIQMVRAIRNVELAMGNSEKKPQDAEKKTAEAARKSLVAACDIRAGTVFSEEMIAVKRPGTGLPASERSQFLGKKARRDIAKDQMITGDMVS
jgi:N-acetylneuraminate synthase